MVASPRSGMATIEHELFAGKSRQMRFLVQRRRIANQLFPVPRWLQVDFDDTWIRSHFEMIDAVMSYLVVDTSFDAALGIDNSMAVASIAETRSRYCSIRSTGGMKT